VDGGGLAVCIGIRRLRLRPVSEFHEEAFVGQNKQVIDAHLLRHDTVSINDGRVCIITVSVLSSQLIVVMMWYFMAAD